MPVYKTKTFVRFARSEGISDASLIEAIDRAARGLVDADLGGGIIKQRVARQGQGRSSGYRTLIAYRSVEFAVFMFGFAKRDRDNIDAAEKADLLATASAWLAINARGLELALDDGLLIEVKRDTTQG